jgi:hypothetical protein
MAVSHSNHTPHRKHTTYFRLSAFHHPRHGTPRLEIHISRAQARAILKEAKLPAGRARGHRKFHVAVFVDGRAFTRLHVETHNSHKRRCADKEATRAWYTR